MEYENEQEFGKSFVTCDLLRVYETTLLQSEAFLFLTVSSNLLVSFFFHEILLGTSLASQGIICKEIPNPYFFFPVWGSGGRWGGGTQGHSWLLVKVKTNIPASGVLSSAPALQAVFLDSVPRTTPGTKKTPVGWPHHIRLPWISCIWSRARARPMEFRTHRGTKDTSIPSSPSSPTAHTKSHLKENTCQMTGVFKRGLDHGRR